MRRISSFTILAVALLANLAFGAPTVFLKDGGRETGTSVWIRDNTVYLSKGPVVYEYAADEVLLEQTGKFNRIGSFAVMATPLPGAGAPAKETSPDLVERLMQVTNIDRQMDQFIQQFSAGVHSTGGANPELGDIFSRALAGFDPQKAKRKVRAYYRRHLDTRSMEAVVAWSTTPLGIKIRAAEEAVSLTTPQAAQQMLADFEQNPPPAGRLALIRDLDKAGRVSELVLQLVMDAASGALSAIPGDAVEQKNVRKEIEAMLKQQRSALEPQLRTQVQAGLAAAYKGLSDNELREYIAFARTEPAAKFSRTTMGALSELTRDLSATLIRGVLATVEKKKTAQP